LEPVVVVTIVPSRTANTNPTSTSQERQLLELDPSSRDAGLTQTRDDDLRKMAKTRTGDSYVAPGTDARRLLLGGY
jgi:hypothetical protein